MNTRVRIDLREHPRGKTPPTMRFFCRVFLQTAGDAHLEALIDTGAPFSIVPFAMWKDGRSMIGLAGPNVSPNCRTICGLSGGSLPCEFGRLHVILSDTQPSFSDWLRIPAKLAMTDAMPLILGVAGFLDTYEVALNRDSESYVVVPGL